MKACQVGSHSHDPCGARAVWYTEDRRVSPGGHGLYLCDEHANEASDSTDTAVNFDEVPK